MRLLLTDDHVMVCEVLARGLTANGMTVRCCYRPEDVLPVCLAWEPDLLLLDISFPTSPLSGFDVLSQARFAHPCIPVIMLSMYEEGMLQRSAHDLGAAGFVPKYIALDSLLEAVQVVAAGGKWFLMEFDEVGVEVLTQQQLNVVRHLANGRTEKEAAADLGIAVSTVEFHLKRARRSSGARTTNELIKMVTDQGLLTLPVREA